jgi:hypothetical protein
MSATRPASGDFGGSKRRFRDHAHALWPGGALAPARCPSVATRIRRSVSSAPSQSSPSMAVEGSVVVICASTRRRWTYLSRRPDSPPRDSRPRRGRTDDARSRLGDERSGAVGVSWRRPESGAHHSIASGGPFRRLPPTSDLDDSPRLRCPRGTVSTMRHAATITRPAVASANARFPRRA